MKKRLLLVTFALLILNAVALAQDKITSKEAQDISYQATQIVQRIPYLLNYITGSDNSPSSLLEAEQKSFTRSNKQLFFNNQTIVESDIDPDAKLGAAPDLTLEKYFTELDIKYEKTDSETVVFSNIRLSSVKRNKDYTYIRVKFDSEFKGKPKAKPVPYPIRAREAMIRADKGGNFWDAKIVSIKFYDPANPLESAENNLRVVTDTTESGVILSEEEVNKQRDSLFLARNEEARRIDAAFKQYVQLGDNNVSEKHYKDALNNYKQALDLKEYAVFIEKKLQETQRLIDENSYDKLKGKAERARDERRYKLAIEYYQQAVGQKPENSAEIQALIKPLTLNLNVISLPQSKLESGSAEVALAECKRILNEHKKEKASFPELYLIQAQAYQLQYEAKPDDSRLKEKVLENYNTAILNFDNYLDARIARAKFNIRYTGDYASAISDYDALIINTLDGEQEKPGYYATKAKLRELNNNVAGAIEDYNKAILLSSKTDSLYFLKGELLYRKKNYTEAKTNFDAAIKLNPKYALAYYYRGLTYAETDNNYQAGVDFVRLEKVGIRPEQLKKIESLSDAFFEKGQTAFGSNDFVNADSAYNTALKLRACNAKALHGKAEIRLVTAEELTKGKKTEEAQKWYQQSIVLNRQAISCDGAFSDAHFKEGLAHYRIAEYDMAITSFTSAIKADAGNIQAFVERGNTYQTQQLHTKAIENYDQALILLLSALEKSKKDNDKGLTNMFIGDLSKVSQLDGKSLYYVKNYVTAITLLTNAINYSPLNSEAFYYRGLVYDAQNELSKAKKDYNEAIKVYGSYRYFYANGIANYKDKDYEQAVNNYGKAITADTLTVYKDTRYLRGLAFYKQKAYSNALTDYADYEKYEGSKSDTLFYVDYGTTELYLNRDASAIDHFNQALKLDAGNARANWGLGCAYAKGGEFDKALALIEKAFAANQLHKDDIKLDEEFLSKLKDVKVNRTKYNALKKTYIIN